jgi:hypothetical protein
MKALRTVTTFLAILAGIAASTIFMPAGNRAEAAAPCPLVLMKLCVQEKNGYKHWAWTNTCFAKQMGLKVLPDRACKGMWW